MAPDEHVTPCPQCGSSFPVTVKLCPNDGTVLEHQATVVRQLGKTLDGKYRLDAFLSQGGMGAVYRATHVMLGKSVAVKLINPELVTSPEVVRRFQREARAANALNHPNIVAVYDLGQTAEGTLYIAMELVNGLSLKSVIESSGPMSASRTIALLRQVASALAVAHRQNIIHRDLKPQNIMIAKDDGGAEMAKLVDFGIAKTFDDSTTQLTATGYALGTPQYMSPEQAEGRAVDARSDLYSLGVILYEMLAGVVPFGDGSASAILIQHIKETPQRPSLRNPRAAVPVDLEAIALRCLEKDPARRFQTADEFSSALERAAASIAGAAASMPATVPIAAETTRRVPAVAAPPSSTRPTVPQAAGALAAAPPSPAASNRAALVALMVVLVLVGAAAVSLGMYVKRQREQSAATAATDLAAKQPSAAVASPEPPAPAPVPPSATPAMAPQPPADANGRRPQVAERSASTRRATEIGGSTSPRPATPPSASAAPPPAAAPGDAPTPARPAVQLPPPAEASFPVNPAVFFHCAGPPEICSVLRAQVDDALEKSGLSSVRSAQRADVDVGARVNALQQKVTQEFSTMLAVRTYSIELEAETTRTSERVAMPPPATLNFDPQFGSERVVEKARLVASDIVDRVKAFAARKRGG